MLSDILATSDRPVAVSDLGTSKSMVFASFSASSHIETTRGCLVARESCWQLTLYSTANPLLLQVSRKILGMSLKLLHDRCPHTKAQQEASHQHATSSRHSTIPRHGCTSAPVTPRANCGDGCLQNLLYQVTRCCALCTCSKSRVATRYDKSLCSDLYECTGGLPYACCWQNPPVGHV